MSFLERKCGQGSGSRPLLTRCISGADNVERELKKAKPFQAYNPTERQTERAPYVISGGMTDLFPTRKRYRDTGLSKIIENLVSRCQFLVGGERRERRNPLSLYDRGGPQRGSADS
jgi:hypothetical protein